MAKNVQVVKITASSTPTAWSQAYHAGNLTAIITVTPKTKNDATSLAIVGKDLLNTFESEYFTIENKNLTTIKEAVETTYKKSATTHHISLLIAAAIQNTLYVVLAGSGEIFLLRKDKIGTILEQNEDKEILSSSGFLEHGDTVVLASPAFMKLVDKEKLFTTLTENNLSDAGDLLTPAVHAASEGDATALFLKYEDENPPLLEEKKDELEENKKETPEIEEKGEEDEHEEKPEPILDHKLPEETKEEPIFSKPLDVPPVTEKKSARSHRRNLLLTIIVILLIVFGVAVYFALAKQRSTQQAALFNTTYPTAQSKYEEGIGLLDLNVTVARQDLTNAKQILEGAKDKFPADSQDGKKILDLLNSVNDKLAIASNVNAVSANKTVPADDSVLAYALAHSEINYLTEDTTNIYTLDDQAITQISKQTQTTKKIITSSWKSAGGFATYVGNFYVLDTTSGIFKFVGSGTRYTKSNYFAQGVSPDLSQAKDMAIDGSIWVLMGDSSVLKFTKGKQDSLTLTGLDKPLASPTRIVTSADMDNVYILDNGNARIVVVDKTGAYKAQYASGLLKTATQLSIDEKGKTATFISSGTAYQIPLK